MCVAGPWLLNDTWNAKRSLRIPLVTVLGGDATTPDLVVDFLRGVGRFIRGPCPAQSEAEAGGEGGAGLEHGAAGDGGEV